jgi:hypothetical protein
MASVVHGGRTIVGQHAGAVLMLSGTAPRQLREPRPPDRGAARRASTWQQGSSYSHLDEATYPAGNANSLMTPQLSSAEAIHSPGPITQALFKSIGW